VLRGVSYRRHGESYLIQFLQTHNSTTNIPVICTFLLQVLVTVSIFALIMFLFAATGFSDGIDKKKCVHKSCPYKCGVTKGTDCKPGERYYDHGCPNCAACVKKVGT